MLDSDVLLFSFEDPLDFSSAAKGLVHVGVTELSSEPLWLGERPVALVDFSIAARGLVGVGVKELSAISPWLDGGPG